MTAARPYPRELEETAELPGLRVCLRPIRPEDAAAFAAFIAGTEAPDLRFRFFSQPRRLLSARELARYTRIDCEREMAFVAVPAHELRREILGEVRIMLYPTGESAEFAILVRSDMKRRGLGRVLLEKAIRYCRSRGQRELIGQIDAANAPMLALARRCGMDLERAPGSSLVVAHLAFEATPRPAARRASARAP